MPHSSASRSGPSRWPECLANRGEVRVGVEKGVVCMGGASRADIATTAHSGLEIMIDMFSLLSSVENHHRRQKVDERRRRIAKPPVVLGVLNITLTLNNKSPSNHA